MLAIQKTQEPSLLTGYRLKDGASFDNLPAEIKRVIKELLLDDQGHLCAYCMSRISFRKMKVEHWLPQNGTAERDLNWKNLLGVCMGNEGMPENQQTCDTRKGNVHIDYNPSESDHRIESKITYSSGGTIGSDEETWNFQLKNTLNLNQARLVENRKAVLEAIAMLLNQKPGLRRKNELKRLIDKWRSKAGGEISPYAGAAVYYLNRKLGSAS